MTPTTTAHVGAHMDDPVEAALSRLDPDVRASLSPEQKDAIVKAYNPGWNGHPVDIRLSVPWIGGRYFLTLVGGGEKRAAERRAAERRNHPLKTVGNLFFMVGLGTVFYMGAIVLFALQSSIIEF